MLELIGDTVVLMLGILFGIVFMTTMFCEHVKPNRYKCGDVVEYEYADSVHIGMITMSKLTLVGYSKIGYKLVRIYRVNDNMRSDDVPNSKIVSALSSGTLVLQEKIFRKVKGDNDNGKNSVL